jgi:hypothetical protein
LGNTGLIHKDDADESGGDDEVTIIGFDGIYNLIMLGYCE